MKSILVKKVKTELSKLEIFQNIKRVYPESSFLDSSYKSKDIGHYSYIAFDVFTQIKAKGGEIILKDNHETKRFCGNPLRCLDKIIEANKIDIRSKYHFLAGGIGYFSYDLKDIIERLPQRAKDDINAPDLYFNFYRTIIIFDEYKRGELTVAFFKTENNLHQRIKDLKNLLSIREKQNNLIHFHVNEPISNFTKASYISAVKKAKRYITEGDIYQVCLSQRFKTDFPYDPWSLYKRLNKINPAPFSAYLDFKEIKVISSSPELFLKAGDGIMETRPMKGTMPRGFNREKDRFFRKKLIGSIKDNAELSMIVDLERNDLGKICQPGSVKVVKHRKVERYATVFQTISIARGLLIDKELNIEEIIRATFPGGSISGCPKIRAMEIIDEIEPTQRGVYTGVIGYLSFHNTAYLNMAIRIIIVKNKKVYFQVGGGIVADSNEEDEYNETLAKAKALIESLTG